MRWLPPDRWAIAMLPIMTEGMLFMKAAIREKKYPGIIRLSGYCRLPR